MDVIKIVGIIALALILLVTIPRLVTKRTKARAFKDIETLKRDDEQVSIYKSLVGQADRLKWLKGNYPAIWKTAQREGNPDRGIIPTWLDMPLIPDAYMIQAQEQALSLYSHQGIGISLDAYEEYVEKNNAYLEEKQQEEREAYREMNRRIEEDRRRAREQMEENRRKQSAAAMKKWSSLSPEAQEQFKNAKGRNGRAAALGDSDDYTATILAPLVMSSVFPELNPNTNSSITHCETNPSYNSYSDHSSSHSSYGSSSSYSSDSGSSYSSDSSSSSSDGGGGGGCD